MPERTERTLYQYNFPQFIELPEFHYFVARTKLEGPEWTALSIYLSQAKKLVQLLNEQLFSPETIYIPTSSHWTDIRQGLTRTAEGISLLTNNREGLDSGLEEIVDSLLAYPNPETGEYSPRISPRLAPSACPYLIEGATIGYDLSNVRYAINGGQRRQLTDFPQKSGQLTKHIPELGLSAGIMLWVNPDYRCEEGLRVVARGGHHLRLKEQASGPEQVSACHIFDYLPSRPSPATGLRICSTVPVRGDQQKYTAILQQVLQGQG